MDYRTEQKVYNTTEHNLSLIIIYAKRNSRPNFKDEGRKTKFVILIPKPTNQICHVSKKTNKHVSNSIFKKSRWEQSLSLSHN